MIKVGNIIKRNLEETVQYLVNYHDVNQGLVQWGIRVVGQVEKEDELPLPYDGEYGDAIAVGTEAPFFFYIWTRASIEGNPDYWFPFGEISIVGPEGPRGEQGPVGPQGEASRWYVGSSVPISPSQKYIEGDMYLQSNGQVYRYQNSTWQPVVSIRGPQGIQGVQGPVGIPGPVGPRGEKGETGDVGGFVNIWGILTNVDQLPTPASLNNLTVAYLVGTAAPYDLYVQIGETSDTAVWTNTGPFNAATLVTVGGVGQNVWSADTKLDKVVRTGIGDFLYGFNSRGEQTTIRLSSGENTFVRGGVPVSASYGAIYQSGVISENDANYRNYTINRGFFEDNKGTKLYKHTITGFSGTTTTGQTIRSIILVSTSSESATGGSETALAILYLDSINSYIPYNGKIVSLTDSYMNQVTLQFHNRLNEGKVESMVIDVENIVDTVTAL